MRFITDVITEILTVVPSFEGHLRHELESIHESACYTAPEAQQLRWVQLQDCLLTNIGTTPTLEWEFEVLSIFSTVPVEEIKKDLGII